jgi:hypothetical protein
MLSGIKLEILLARIVLKVRTISWTYPAEALDLKGSHRVIEHLPIIK